jgi:hypothetical protein
MGIREIPAGFDEFRAVKVAYEAEHFRYADTNREIGDYTLGLMCSWYPRALRPAVRLGVRALLDDAMRAAFGFAAAPAWVAKSARGALRMRAGVVARMPARKTNRLASDPRNRTYPGYPQGYRPADLGVDN